MTVPHAPRIILFDWHATLVDTMDAMYQAMDDMLAMLDLLGLRSRLVPADQSKTPEDRRLVEYVREHLKLHPKIIEDRKVSRTDLLEVLFGRDEEAKDIAHRAFTRSYRQHYGDVKPFEPDIRHVLSELRKLGIKIGILSNRVREFLEHELEFIERGTWFALFDSVVAGDDTVRLKPAPDPIFRALEDMRAKPGPDAWYVGDSTTDTIAAKNAGITSIFFNGARWDADWMKKIFPGTPEHPRQPDYVVNSFAELLLLVRLTLANDAAAAGHQFTRYTRPLCPLPDPRLILFDWHATLADTLDAMYHAVDDVLPKLAELGLADRLVDPRDSKNENDRKLVLYVRENFRLHPKIRAARKISRTDIFEILFGQDEEAKRKAHQAFNHCYRDHYGHVEPLEPGIRDMLEWLRNMGIATGVLSNRDREFLEHELECVEPGGWRDLFDTIVAGDDTASRKPSPDPVLKAVANLGMAADVHTWYVGDSTTDTTSAKAAHATSVFYNGAQWSDAWLNKIFPGTPRYPHKPDQIIDNFEDLIELVKLSRGQSTQKRLSLP